MQVNKISLKLNSWQTAKYIDKVHVNAVLPAKGLVFRAEICKALYYVRQQSEPGDLAFLYYIYGRLLLNIHYKSF